jgi:hypothetical protein
MQLLLRAVVVNNERHIIIYFDTNSSLMLGEAHTTKATYDCDHNPLGDGMIPANPHRYHLPIA